jgi:hypothetical protein
LWAAWPNPIGVSFGDVCIQKGDRQRLSEARADIQRQVEILEAGPLIRAREVNQFESLIDDLRGTLKEIVDSLAALGEDRG